MKRILIIFLFLFSNVWAAKTVIPTLKPVYKTKAPIGEKVGGVGGDVEGGVSSSPLDIPFTPKYTFKGVSRNIIPIGTKVYIQKNQNWKYSACSALRFHKYWIVTAAHCLDDVANTDQWVTASIKEHEKGLYEVIVSKTSEGSLPNAKIFFIKQGYTEQDFLSSHVDDIALIRLEKNDVNLDIVEKNLQQAIQEGMGSMHLIIQQHLRNVQLAKKLRRAFLEQPLDKYRFYITDSTKSFVNRTASVFRFPGNEKQERFSPEKNQFKFLGQREGDNNHPTSPYMLFWQSDAPSLSGSPIIINGLSVSNASGPFGEGERVSPMYTERFHSFLKKSMGAEYTSGLCIRSESGGSASQTKAQQKTKDSSLSKK